MGDLRNDRLAVAMRQAGVSRSRLAAEVGVDPKTVERWISGGRTPHPRHREIAATLLEQPVAALWDVPDDARDALPGEIVALYPSRRDVPYSVWQGLMAHVTERFELYAIAALFLPDQTVNLATEMLALAERGVRIRVLLGNPDGEATARRDVEEGRVGVDGRVRLVLGYVAPALVDPRIKVRLHDTTLYASTYRFDDDLLVNQHVWGSPAGANPLLHLRGPDTAPLIAAYQQGFERVGWREAARLLAARRVRGLGQWFARTTSTTRRRLSRTRWSRPSRSWCATTRAGCC